MKSRWSVLLGIYKTIISVRQSSFLISNFINSPLVTLAFVKHISLLQKSYLTHKNLHIMLFLGFITAAQELWMFYTCGYIGAESFLLQHFCFKSVSY